MTHCKIQSLEIQQNSTLYCKFGNFCAIEVFVWKWLYWIYTVLQKMYNLLKAEPEICKWKSDKKNEH